LIEYWYPVNKIYLIFEFILKQINKKYDIMLNDWMRGNTQPNFMGSIVFIMKYVDSLLRQF